tara:strand:+ start:247 stop:1125 length:879 start_codon:yes stop_codon:yes gene_type:complete
MSNLPKAYKVCKIKITKNVLKIPKKKIKVKEKITINKKIGNIDNKILETDTANLKAINLEPKLDNKMAELNINNLKDITLESQLDNKVIDRDNFINNISLTIETYNNTNITYDKHFISITLVYNFRLTNNPIDDLDKTYLIGTNILTYTGNKLPVFKINDIDNIKYKKLVREKCKELWNVKNKYIASIKHINNYKNFHNYLVLLDNSNKSTVKFIKKFKNQMNTCEKDYCWRTFFGMYSPNNINPSKREVYENIAKITLPSLNLSLKEFENNKLQIKNIYKSLSFCIGDEIY